MIVLASYSIFHLADLSDCLKLKLTSTLKPFVVITRDDVPQIANQIRTWQTWQDDAIAVMLQYRRIRLLLGKFLNPKDMVQANV